MFPENSGSKYRATDSHVTWVKYTKKKYNRNIIILSWNVKDILMNVTACAYVTKKS